MDLFNKVNAFEPTKSHIYEPNISLISLNNLMFNYAKPQFWSEMTSIRNVIFCMGKQICTIRLQLRTNGVLAH